MHPLLILLWCLGMGIPCGILIYLATGLLGNGCSATEWFVGVLVSTWIAAFVLGSKGFHPTYLEYKEAIQLMVIVISAATAVGLIVEKRGNAEQT